MISFVQYLPYDNLQQDLQIDKFLISLKHFHVASYLSHVHQHNLQHVVCSIGAISGGKILCFAAYVFSDDGSSSWPRGTFPPSCQSSSISSFTSLYYSRTLPIATLRHPSSSSSSDAIYAIQEIPRKSHNDGNSWDLVTQYMQGL